MTATPCGEAGGESLVAEGGGSAFWRAVEEGYCVGKSEGLVKSKWVGLARN